jgi:FtsH-binding integral membrane protein
MFGLGVMGLGLGGAPLIAIASAVSPTIVPTCLGLTAAIFGGASLMAYNMKKDSMLKYGGVLLGGLLGLIGLQLGGLAAAFFMGPNMFSLMMLKSSSYISVALFSAFILYDTHVAIKMYEMGQPDHLAMATQFLLDIWNIFTSLLRIFSSNNS